VPAILQIPAEGGAVISFLDVAARPQPMQWAMTFDKKGKLLKATHTPTFTTAPTAVPPTLENVQGTPVPPTLLEVTGTTRP
jgi:hypothetical protein